MKRIALAVALTLAVPLSAQAANYSAHHYGTSEALMVQDARLAEVLMVREVSLNSDKRVNSGSAIGAAVGYGVARQVMGDQRRAAQVAGTALGAIAGTGIQNRLSQRRAFEIYVREVDDRRGRVLAIVQDMDVDIRKGDRVFLVGKGKKTQVVTLIPEARLDPTRIDACDVSVGNWAPDACDVFRFTWSPGPAMLIAAPADVSVGPEMSFDQAVRTATIGAH